jgi:hypothetical protein
VEAVDGGKFVTCLPVVGGIAFNNDGHSIARWLGLRGDDGAPLDVAKVFGLNALVAAPINWLLWMFMRPVDFADVVFSKLLPEQGCTDPNYIQLQATRTVTGFMTKWVGPGLDGIDNKAAQQAHSLCPSMLPSPDNALEIYLADQTDLDTAKCWARAGDSTEAEWVKLVDARQTRLNNQDLLSLWRRDLLTDDELFKRMRELGYTDKEFIAELMELTEQIPPASDLVSFMVRDVEDPEIVGPFELDKHFTDKFQGKVKEWAKNQGVSEDYMRRIWRAHWQIPSPTQLFDFWHLLRYNPDFGPPEKLKGDIVRALEQQDILPFWINHYLAASFRPPTRVDTRRMFIDGTMNEQDVFLAYVKAGYSDEDAKRLQQFAINEKKKKLLTDPMFKAYQQGLVSGSELTANLTSKGWPATWIDEGVAKADLNRTIEKRKVCHAAWKKRYLAGEFDDVQAVSLLTSDGLNSGTVQTILAGWQCAKTSKTKTLPASQACTLFQEGIIDSANLYNRLLNLHYQTDDALALVQDCEYKLGVKRTAAVNKQITQAQKYARQQKAAFKEAAAAESKREAQATAALNKARAVQKSRRHLILEIAFNYAGQNDTEPGDAVDLVDNLAKTLASNHRLGLDPVLEAGVKVSKSPTVSSPDGLASEWGAVLQGLHSEAGNP